MSDSLDTLLPHRPPMQWINALLDCSEKTARASACFSPGSFAVADGAVVESALIECAAQTAAAALGQRARRAGIKSAGPSQTGMLTAVSNFAVRQPPPLDRVLLIDIEELGRFGPMLKIASTITCDGQLIATGELSLYA